MKKFMMTLAAVLCCTMTTFVFTSCGSDDKEEEQQQPASQEILGIGARYLIKVTRQMTEYCDYTATYYSKDNELTTEKMEWTFKDANDTIATWVKDANSVKLPATFGVKVQVALKEGVQLEGVKIKNMFPTTKLLYVQGITKDRQIAWEKTLDLGAGVSSHGGVSGEKLHIAIEEFEQHGGVVNYFCTLDKDGNKVDSGKIQ